MGIGQIKNEDTFGYRATTVLQNVRISLLRTFESIGDLSGQRPIDLSTHLGIDMKLAWKASRLVRSVNPAEILNELPGRPGFKKLVDAAAKAGASSDSLEQLLHTRLAPLFFLAACLLTAPVASSDVGKAIDGKKLEVRIALFR